MSSIHINRPPWWTGDVPYDIPPGFDLGVFSSSVHPNNIVLAALEDLSKNYQSNYKDGIFNKKYFFSSIVPDSLKRSAKDYHGEKVINNPGTLIIDMTKLLNKPPSF